MRYDAVIFDLFGTLVPTPKLEPFIEDHRRTAEAFGLDPDAYLRAWYTQQMGLKRSLGIFPTMADAIRAACEKLGASPSAEQIAAAAARRVETTRCVLSSPRPDAIETLEGLAKAGLKRGMISDCSEEVPRVWNETPFAGHFDAVAFSCVEGIKKPDPRLYGDICAKLGVGPDQCLFVGDGASPELTGAREVGMDAALICPPGEVDVIMSRTEGSRWDGRVIGALSEVLDLA